MDLTNQKVVITGGSRGFGKSLAKAFIAEGAQVVILSNNKDELEKTVAELSADYFVADVTNYEDLEALGDHVVKKYGKVDIWINNAGIHIAPSSVEEVDRTKLHRLFEVNFFGYFYGCQVALRHMKKQGSGLIINVNSTAGLEGKPELSAYCSSKCAVKGLTESIRNEVVGSEIQIHALFPGGMHTDIYHEKYPSDINEYMLVDDVTAKVIANLRSDNPEQDFIIRRPKKQI
jgi:NAD(P)-dependent dehydrogenase (short-subunit alcohol dehydrogenase family)